MILPGTSKIYTLLFFCFLSFGKVQAQCQSSTNLGVRKMTPMSTEAYWTPGSGKAFLIDYGLKGYGPPDAGDGYLTTKNHISLGIKLNSSYEFWIKDSCGPNNHSAWAGPFRFTPPPWPSFHQPIYQQLNPKPCKVLAIADMNKDFRKDVVVGTGYTSDPAKRNRLLLYHQTSRGLSSILPFEYRVGSDTLRSLDVGDVKAGQYPEVVVGYGDSVAVYSVKANGGLKRDTTLYSGSKVYDVRCSDLNNDGKTDFAVYHAGENSVRVFYQNNSMKYTSQVYACITGPRGELDVGDLNADKRTDLAVMTSDPPAVHIFYANSAGGFNAPVSLQSSDTSDHIFEGMAIGDFHGDGYKDIMISRRGPVQAGWKEYWHQDSSGSLQYFNYPYSSGQVINSGDMNCDGFYEIYGVIGKILPNATPTHNIWFFNYLDPNNPDLSQGWRLHFSISYQTSNIGHYHPKSIGLGDLNGDHKPDLAVADVDRGLVIFYNNADIQPSIIQDSLISVEISTHTDSFSAPVDSFSFSTTDTSYGFYTVRQYQNLVVNLYQMISTQTDSTKWEYKAFCEHYFSDTTVYSATTHDTTLLKTDTITTVTEKKVPWDDDDYDHHLAIYPNPTFGEVFFEVIPGGDEVKSLQLEGFNDQGKHVFSKRLEFVEKGSIDLGHFADAVYHFRIKWDGRTFERSVVKQ